MGTFPFMKKALMLGVLLMLCALGRAVVVGTSGPDDLVVAGGRPAGVNIVVSPDGGPWEKRAAQDLQRCIKLMTGAIAPVVNETSPDTAAIVVGRAAIAADPTLPESLNAKVKKNPLLRGDAIVARRSGNRLFLAGTNDESHYYAASWLLQQWGCRWYLPTEFGECIPQHLELKVGALDYAYAPPFEVRHYWLSWNADSTGAEEFQRRNFMSSVKLAGMGHALGQYTKKLIPPGKTMFNVPLAEDATAQEVASQIEGEYAKGVPGISLAIEDGNYVSDSARDKTLQGGIYDKYALQPSNTDAMMSLYNRVGKILREKYPKSPTKIGGMAYANVTLPPQKVLEIEPNVVMWLAPIDIDPNHGMDDPRSPPRQEYREMLYRWAKLMQGRLAIYDYDQGQLVWRDLPNPSHTAFAADVKHYAKAGILGIGTESRGAGATTFLNLFFRGQLMWNPDAEVSALLDEFFPKFYGPAGAAMSQYWRAIFDAWDTTLVTEHEYFAARAIYTPELVKKLKGHLDEARRTVEPWKALGNVTAEQTRILERVRFTELSFAVLEAYMAMQAAVSECDYRAAVVHGERGLAKREDLTSMNPTFTTYKKIGEHGAAWWPGEVQQYRELLALTDGSKGSLVAKAPVEWSFRRDPRDTGLPRGWAYTPADLSAWNERGKALPIAKRKDWLNDWEIARADLYFQAQGIRHPDEQSYTGHYWYQTSMQLEANQVEGRVRLMFPGAFNELWLYVNGELVAHREYQEPWWRNDYKFQWDVDLAGKLKPGANLISLRGFNPHHFGGLFRTPFIYRAAAP